MLHDRNPLYVQLSDGGMRNGYTVKILNKLLPAALLQPRAWHGLPGAALSIVGHEQESRPGRDRAPDELQVAPPLCHARQERRRRASRRRPPSSPSWSPMWPTDTRVEHQRDVPRARAMSSRASLARRGPRRAPCADGSHRLLRRRCSSSTAIFVYFAAVDLHRRRPNEPYRKGLDYNETLGGGERQAARGWQTEIGYDDKPDGCTSSVARQRRRRRSPGLQIDAALSRPATDKEDRAVELD